MNPFHKIFHNFTIWYNVVDQSEHCILFKHHFNVVCLLIIDNFDFWALEILRIEDCVKDFDFFGPCDEKDATSFEIEGRLCVVLQ